MLRKIATAISKRWGSPDAKRQTWDLEYASGKWTYDRAGINNERQEPIYSYLERYGNDGSVLDLGCGSGMTALEMKNNFREYTGVDVSEVAVNKARSLLSEEADRCGKVRFFAADIYSFVPDRRFSVILFRESIYYVPQHRIKAMLQRYRAHLLDDGVFIVRLCDTNRYKGIIRIVESNFRMIEKYTPRNSSAVVLVCSDESSDLS